MMGFAVVLPILRAYPELNIVSSCGVTKEEAINNLQEAIALMLEPIPENQHLKNSTY